jgi:gas vesicle protein
MRGLSKSHAAGLFFTGAAVGAVAAFLLAPKNGAQTRKEIARFSKKAMDQLDDFQSGIRDQISGGYAQVKKMIRTA